MIEEGSIRRKLPINLHLMHLRVPGLTRVLPFVDMTVLASSSQKVVHDPTSKPSLLVSFVTAGLGGMVGWVVVHPFNTASVRMNLATGAVTATGKLLFIDLK